MNTLTETSTWHYNPDVDHPDFAYPALMDSARWTRNRPPVVWHDTTSCREFSKTQMSMASAVHEAGHAVAHLARGARVERVEIFDPAGGEVDYRYTTEQSFHTLATAAGERSETRWLHESGLWTETRGWAAERTAGRDRAFVNELIHGELTYGVDPTSAWDYSYICDRTDEMLDSLWGRVMDLARYVAVHHRIAGDQAATITGLANREAASQ